MSYQWIDDQAVYVKKTIINYNHDADGNFNQITLTLAVDADIPNASPAAQNLYNGVITAVETFLASNTDYDGPLKYTYQVISTQA